MRSLTNETRPGLSGKALVEFLKCRWPDGMPSSVSDRRACPFTNPALRTLHPIHNFFLRVALSGQLFLGKSIS